MVRIHREPPILEGPPGGAVPYKHFGARLARLGRFDSCTLYQKVRAGSSTDQNSWPTTNRCGFNSRTAHQGRISSKVEPAIDNREVLVRFQHPAPTLCLSKGDWQRWLMHSPLKRDQAGSIPASPTSFAGLADAAMHSPFKRDEAGSIPASRTKSVYEGASSNRIRTEPSKL